MRDYKVLRQIAEGSAAEAFLARGESPDERPFVVELMRRELTLDTEMYGRFLDAAKEHRALVHPSLLSRAESGCDADGRVFTITEPTSGVHLGNLLVERGPLHPAEMVRVMLPICDAVEYLHQHGIVHGYLRPSNVFLDGPVVELKPKLLDTGLVLFRSTRSVIGPTDRILVEPEYLAPERIRGHRADILSDVYGLGVLMFELLAGVPPFRSADPEATRRLHLEQAAPPLPDGCGRLTPIILRCLRKDAADRYPSVGALRQALAWYASTPAHGVPRAVTPARLGTPVPPPPAVPPLDPTVVLREQSSRPQTPVPPPPAIPPLNPTVVLRDQTPRPAPTVQSADELVIGPGPDAVIGNYELERLIGEGGMGRVFRARHARLGKRVALKVLRPELAGDPEQIRRFFREARAVNRVNHAHIVEIHDFVEEPESAGGHIYLVMELLEGRTLRALGKEGPLSIARSVAIIRQVCDALGAAHEAGVLHRDVKPDNVFITERDGVKDYVKMLDFGIAKLRAGDTLGLDSTRVGMVLGTPAYMAPEQAMGETDARSDIYSVGTVLYAMLSGRLPFDAAEATSVLISRLLREPAPPLGERAASGEPLPPALRDAVAKCLEKVPRDRPQTMRELSVALAPFDERAFPTPATRLLPRPPERRWPKRLFAGVLLALAAGALGVELYRRLVPEPPATIEVSPPDISTKSKHHHR